MRWGIPPPLPTTTTMCVFPTCRNPLHGKHDLGDSEAAVALLATPRLTSTLERPLRLLEASLDTAPEQEARARRGQGEGRGLGEVVAGAWLDCGAGALVSAPSQAGDQH